ncbi:MAG TPA: fasciclin domain-containing protein [Rubricoccaceae bacterium]|jgi:uncharacterized surface protein with fasciclin (FAS1) repeats
MNKILPVALMGLTLLGGCMTVKSPEDVADSVVNAGQADEMAGMDHSSMGAGVMVGGAMMLPTQTLVENASGASNLTTLVAAVQAAGLVETLSGPGPFTVFAPPNSAFEALPAGTVETLVRPENRAQLTSILTYHVVPGNLKAADLRDGQVLTTVNGQRLTVRKTGNTVTVGGATVTQADVRASNGVAHVIDRVLMPSM